MGAQDNDNQLLKLMVSRLQFDLTLEITILIFDLDTHSKNRIGIGKFQIDYCISLFTFRKLQKILFNRATSQLASLKISVQRNNTILLNFIFIDDVPRYYVQYLCIGRSIYIFYRIRNSNGLIFKIKSLAYASFGIELLLACPECRVGLLFVKSQSFNDLTILFLQY